MLKYEGWNNIEKFGVLFYLEMKEPLQITAYHLAYVIGLWEKP